MSIGDEVKLECLKETQSAVTNWLFERNGITNSVDRDRYGDGELIISSFDPSDAGLYRCVVDSCISKPAKLLYLNSKLVNNMPGEPREPNFHPSHTS